MGEPSRLLVVGGGGHGRVVAETAQLTGRFERIAVIDEKAVESWRLPSIECHASERDIAAHPDEWGFVVAIGHAPTRRRLFSRYSLAGFRAASVIHPAASVSRSAELGEGVVVLAGAVVAAQARIGQGAIVNHNAVVEHDCHLGAFTHMAPGSVIAGGSSLGESSFLGACASIRHGISVGPDITIGNGAAVIHSLDQPGIYVGVPARLMARD